MIADDDLSFHMAIIAAEDKYVAAEAQAIATCDNVIALALAQFDHEYKIANEAAMEVIRIKRETAK